MAGFATGTSLVVTQQIAPDYATYAEKLAAGADSVLIQLPTEVFRRGIDAIKNYAAGTGDKRVIEPIDVFVFR